MPHFSLVCPECISSNALIQPSIKNSQYFLNAKSVSVSDMHASGDLMRSIIAPVRVVLQPRNSFPMHGSNMWRSGRPADRWARNGVTNMANCFSFCAHAWMWPARSHVRHHVWSSSCLVLGGNKKPTFFWLDPLRLIRSLLKSLLYCS